jgi:hypothetical protein
MAHLKKLKISEVRTNFFSEFPQFKNEYKRGKKHNDYTTDCRCTFNDYCDSLHKSLMISNSVVQRITLG